MHEMPDKSESFLSWIEKSVYKVKSFYRKLNLKSRILLLAIIILLFWSLMGFLTFRLIVIDYISGQIINQYQTLSDFIARSLIPLVLSHRQEHIL